MDPKIRAKAESFLAENGLRLTSQRQVIIEAALGTTEHYTADQLLACARKQDPSISRATVYRTLPLLVKSGLLQELDLGRDFKYYDPNYIQHPDHHHLICVDCQKIFEFEDPSLEEQENAISRKMGFQPRQKRVRIEASCDALKQSGACKNACG